MLMHNPNTGELLEVISTVDETILIWAADTAHLHCELELADKLRAFVDRAVLTRNTLGTEWYALVADPA